MSSAVRLGDQSVGHCFHARANTQGSPNVFINGKAAHRIGDYWPAHTCGNSTHDGKMSQGSPNVFVNGKALARVGDAISCGDIAGQGSPNVFVN